MRVLLLLCVLEALALSGCRKKTSPEFYKLDSQQSVLLSRDGDDAYLTAEMASVIAGLQAIPEDAVEKDKATALATKLSAEQTRVQAERAVAVAPKPEPVNPFANRESSISAETPPATAEGVPDADEDAGPPPVVQPWPGMDEKTFVERYGTCFTAGDKTSLPDGKPATAYLLNGSAECQKQYGAPGTRFSYLFTAKGLWGKASETTSVVDAGILRVPGPPAPPSPEPGPPIITTPGAPLPEGYEKVSPP